MTQHDYTFGDGNRASQRLARLAQTFEPSLRTFLARTLTPGADLGLALDLGCGSGHTTRTLAECVGPARVIGLDRSEAFLEEGRIGAPEPITLLLHDVCEQPFPVGPADLVYSRFLLTHLAEPAAVVRGWASAMAPRGRLLLQETAVLESDHPTLARYYELVGLLQRHYGQELHIGLSLEELAACPELRVLDSRLTELGIPAATMAELHLRNLATWRQDPFAREAFDARELDELGAGLVAIVEGSEPASVRVALGELVAEARRANVV